MDTEARQHFKIARFITEAGTKLKTTSVTMATASRLYHHFFNECQIADYDPYLIATTCIYLAGKVEEQHMKLRDVLNVCHRCIHKNRIPFETSESYWAYRDSVVNTELLVMRVMKFQVSFDHPHKYLLHYLKSILDWVDPETRKNVPLAQVSWALLRDSYHGNLCLNYKPQHISIAILFMATQFLGVDVPFNSEAETKWWEVFSEDISAMIIKNISRDIMDLYEMEVTAI